MAELATLARPYAKAVFELAKADRTLDQWSWMLALLAAAGAAPKIRRLLEAPDLSAEVKAARLVEVGGEDLSDRAKALVGILAQNRRLDLLGEIREQFEVRKAEEERVLDVEVVTAQALSQQQSDNLRDALQRRFEREVNLTSRVDGQVLGGAVIRAGDTVIDASLRGRLDKLAESLQRH